MVSMESLFLVLSSSPPLQNHSKILKSTIPRPKRNIRPPSAYISCLRNHLSVVKNSATFTTIRLLGSLPSLAAETLVSPTEQGSNKISIESILVSIDEFFNRCPFFVASCAFIWLVVIPLTQEYLSKYKFISAIDAFRKLRENPETQLLDIRESRSLAALGSPNLKILNKNVVQVEFFEGNEDGFVKSVLDKFQDPENTTLCILDNFDGNSLIVAELLFKNGFREAYAIRGGVRGKKGWLEIQEDLLPPSVHIYPKKKAAKISRKGISGGVSLQNNDRKDIFSTKDLAVGASQGSDNGHVNKSTNSSPTVAVASRSPYPNYPDLKPPSSPTPSKP